MFRLSIFSITIIAVIHCLGPLQSQPQTKPAERKPVLSLSGVRSQIKDRRVLRITNATDFETLWREHKLGKSEMKRTPDNFEYLELNFDEAIVIAIFDGKSHSNEYSAPSIIETDRKLTLRIPSNLNQTGHDVQPDRQPWGIFVIPRTGKEIVLEQDARRLITDNPLWKVWMTFPKVESKK